MKGRSLGIGATDKHADVANSTLVGEAIPALSELAGLIGDPAVRHKGTIGGSLANNDPTADYPAACLALGATIVTNKRRLKPEEFFQVLFTTALESDEIIIRVMFPLPLWTLALTITSLSAPRDTSRSSPLVAALIPTLGVVVPQLRVNEPASTTSLLTPAALVVRSYIVCESPSRRD